MCCGAGEYITTIAGTVILSALSVASFGSARTMSKPATDVIAVAPAETAALDAPANRKWCIDLVPALLDDGRRLRVLAVVDENSHQALATLADTAFSGPRVVRELDRLIAEHGKPDVLTSDTWPEFGSRTVLDWTQKTRVEWKFLEQTAPNEPEPLIVTFAHILRDDCLARGVANIIEARLRLESWRAAYNRRIIASHDWQPTGPVGHEAQPAVIGARTAAAVAVTPWRPQEAAE